MSNRAARSRRRRFAWQRDARKLALAGEATREAARDRCWAEADLDFKRPNVPDRETVKASRRRYGWVEVPA